MRNLERLVDAIKLFKKYVSLCDDKAATKCTEKRVGKEIYRFSDKDLPFVFACCFVYRVVASFWKVCFRRLTFVWWWLRNAELASKMVEVGNKVHVLDYRCKCRDVTWQKVQSNMIIYKLVPHRNGHSTRGPTYHLHGAIRRE